ncbi:hypothetical protein B0T14DRAFT_605696 [Immersiella caudata]|uniref:Uncharacterized protein n=1 Tax=Immersiella caudata TaxID=314043 RepID=A0AA39WLM1_9PEZI|nr:hypothetical protein B0T14DRAFT_605696 [Immersiella caudata]
MKSLILLALFTPYCSSLDIPAWVRANETVSFDHATCEVAVREYMKSNVSSIVPLDLIFMRGPDNALQMADENMVLTIPACEQLCGNLKPNWYVDRGPRLMTWIIPIILLLSNIELSPLDKRRFFTLFQALGDPIDVLWSLLDKLQTRTKIYDLASQRLGGAFRGDDQLRTRIVATVLASFEDLIGPDLQSLDQLIRIMDHFDPADASFFDLWREAASELSDGRTDERLRSLFAIMLYILQILSAFVFDIGGGSPNPPGGVIALALTLTFLIPMVLLSATIGAFTSRRGALRILRAFVWQSGKGAPASMEGMFTRRGIITSTRETMQWDEYFRGLHWNGGKDTYRPWKLTRSLGVGSTTTTPFCAPLDRPLNQPRDTSKTMAAVRITPISTTSPVTPQRTPSPKPSRWKPLLTPLIATTPIISGLTGGLGILVLAGEGGWSCRHVLLLCMLASWLLSSALSSLPYLFLKWSLSRRGNETVTPAVTNGKPRRGSLHSLYQVTTSHISTRTSNWRKHHWHLCLAKDIILGVSILLFVCITAAGFFNSCSCWGRRLFSGDSVGVALNVNPKYIEYNRNKFPGIVSGVVGFQLGWAFLVGLRNRKGIMVLRWGEVVRQEVWEGLGSSYGGE